MNDDVLSDVSGSYVRNFRGFSKSKEKISRTFMFSLFLIYRPQKIYVSLKKIHIISSFYM